MAKPVGFAKKYGRLLIGVAMLSGLLYLARHVPITECEEIRGSIATWGSLAATSFFILYVTATVAFVPVIVMTLLAGLAFGALWGTIIVTVALTTGAALAFLIGRHLAPGPIEGLLSRQGWFERFKYSIEEKGFNFVVLARLVPLFPHNGLNYACGLVPLKFRHYIFGSFLGILPSTFTYVYLGDTGCKLINPIVHSRLSFIDFPPEVHSSLLIAIILLAGLAVMPILIRTIRNTKPRRQHQ